jgi:hypothetical protein
LAAKGCTGVWLERGCGPIGGMGAEKGFASAAVMGMAKIFGAATVCAWAAEAIPAARAMAIPHWLIVMAIPFRRKVFDPALAPPDLAAAALRYGHYHHLG